MFGGVSAIPPVFYYYNTLVVSEISSVMLMVNKNLQLLNQITLIFYEQFT